MGYGYVCVVVAQLLIIVWEWWKPTRFVLAVHRAVGERSNNRRGAVV